MNTDALGYAVMDHAPDWFDFCEGARVRLPEHMGRCRVTLTDTSSGAVLHDVTLDPGDTFVSDKKYFMPWRIDVYGSATGRLNHSIPYDANGQAVLIQMPLKTLGDTFGWLPYAEKFRLKHGCRLIVKMHEKFIPLFEKQYPDITFVSSSSDIPEEELYAAYKIGLFNGEEAHRWQPYDHRLVGLHRTAAHILGVDPADDPPLLDLCAPRQISEPYICIAAQSTAQCKYWNNPRGWKEVVAFLKGCGYRVLCIDRHSSFGSGRLTNRMPEGAESWTGDRPLQERIDILKDADFFIGLPSGLSWMAWACRVPVVIISGFSDPVTEFYTPYRVSTPEGFCRACWNDMTVRFDRKDWAWCPRHKGTHQQFECSRNITSDQVINAIRMIPAFRKRTQEK